MKNIKPLMTILALSLTPLAFAAGTHNTPHDSMYSTGRVQGGGGHWMAPAREQNRANPIEATAASIKKGSQLYHQKCVSCHGPNAEGDGMAGMMLEPKPANLRAMVGQHPDGDFAWKIREGRGPMPAWKDQLSDQQVWHLVNYIQNLDEKPLSGDGQTTGHGDGHGHGH